MYVGEIVYRCIFIFERKTHIIYPFRIHSDRRVIYMKKMKIEKQLIFADNVKKVATLQVHEGLTYKHDDEGIRAMGPLYIKGQYEGNEGIEEFQETLEMDILAPQEKLNGENFYLEVADYQGIAVSEGIQICVTLNIHGIKDGSKTMIDDTKQKDDVDECKQASLVTPIESIPTPLPKKVISQSNTTIEEKKNRVDSVERVSKEQDEQSEDVEVSTPVDDFEDLFADAESTYTSYRIIVAKPNDSYEAISQRYEVDEIALRNTNKNKDVVAKTLVILPFQK